MQPYSITVPGFLQVTQIRPGQPDTVTWLSTIKKTASLQGGGIVKGNHRSPNPFWYRKDVRNCGTLEATYIDLLSGNQDIYSGPYIGPTEGQATWVTEDKDAAVAQAYAKLVDNIRGGLDLSVDLFQARQTIGTPKQVGKILTEFRKVAKQLKRGDIQRPMKTAGKAWLIWVYGVKPTMQSIHDLASFHRKKYLDELKVFEGSATVQRDVTVPIPNWPGSGWSSTQRVQTSCRARFKVRMKVPDTALTSAARLSSLNPASIAWELMPWSFVVDWFFNIGDYLRGVESSLVYGRYFSDGFLTETYVGSGNQTAVRDPSPPGVLQTGTYQADGRTTILDRKLLYSYPDVPTPKLRAELGSARLLNAAALLSTFLGRKSN